MQVFRDSAVYWRSPLLPGAELLTAEYYGQEFAPHWHDSYSISVIQAGAQTYRYRGGKRLAVVGNIAAINPGEIHTGERAGEQGWAYRAFYPSVEWMRGLAGDIAGRATDVPWLPDDAIADPETAAMLANAHYLLEDGTDLLGADTALTAAFALLLSRHARHRPLPQPLHGDGERVARMQARMAEDLAQALTLSELAATVELSPFHAARLFSAAVGMPPHAWRNQLRLNRALGLLRRGMAVTEVAAATGFADQSHFTRRFKRAYGASPGHWRTA